MGYHNQRQFLMLQGKHLQSMIDFLLRLAIERRRGLIKKQDLGILIERTCNADTLFLPTRQTAAVFPQRRIQALRQCVRPLLELHLFQDLHHLGTVSLRLAKRYIVGKRALYDKYLLRDIAHQFMPSATVGRCQLLPIYKNLARCRFKKAEHQVEKR